MLQPLIEDERNFALAVAPVWSMLTQEIRETLIPLVEGVVLRSLNQLNQARTSEPAEPQETTTETEVGTTEVETVAYGSDEWWNSYPGEVVTPLFGLLGPSEQRQVVERIFALPKNHELLFDLLPQLPQDLQAPTALWLIRNPTPRLGNEDRSWSTQTEFAHRIAPFLPEEERVRALDELLTELRAAAPGQVVVQKLEEGEEEGAVGLSFWGEALSVVRQLLPLWSEAQLRSLIAWLEGWPQSADRNSDDRLLTQDEIWTREQMVALLSSRLASLAAPDEARQLMRRVWEFALFYPYYPEHGGNGADPDPEGVALSPEEVDAQVRRLDPEAQKVWLRESIHALAKRDAGDLIEAVHQAVHQVRRDAVELPAMLERRVAAPQPEVVLRTLFLQGKIPSQVVAGQSFVARVRLSPQQSELSARLREITLQPGDNSIRLLVSAPDFDVPEDERQHQLLVPPDGASSWLAFELRPRRVGRFQVQILAFQGSNYST